MLACVVGSSGQEPELDYLLCRAQATGPTQAAMFYQECPPNNGPCEQKTVFANGLRTANITAPVSALIKFRVRFLDWGNPPLTSVRVQPTRLMSRVTVGPITADPPPTGALYADVSWFNSTSDVSIPYNCLDLVLNAPGQCAFRVCRKDCTTPTFVFNHLTADYQREGGVGTRESPIVMRKRMQAQVGEPISFLLKLQNVVLTDLVDIEGRVDGGIPIGMEFGAKQMEGTTVTTREVMWTPHKGQQGYQHVAHFVGWNCAPPGDTVPCPVSMVYLDIVFDVETPQTSWFYPDNEDSGGSIPPEILTQHVVVGQRTEIELACRAIDSSSTPQISLLNASTDGELASALPMGVGPMGNAGWGLVREDVEGEDDRRLLLRFNFTPAVGDEGGVKSWCFTCGDAQDLGALNARCITLSTQLCRVAVQPGDTIQSITRQYHLDRNWRRVWNTNPHIPNPYVELHAGTALQVGPIYRVRPADTLTSIAARFETTVKKVLMVNPHLGETDARELPVGLDMCVLPCTNKPPPSHFIGTKLLDSPSGPADMPMDRQ